jgi:hypothetical protein
MNLSNFPSEVLSIIVSQCEAVSIGLLWFTGDLRLHKRLSDSHGIQQFALQMNQKRMKLHWPNLVSNFKGLLSFALLVPDRRSSMASKLSFLLETLPPTLNKLYLRCNHFLPPSQPYHLSVLFPVLETLYYDSETPFYRIFSDQLPRLSTLIIPRWFSKDPLCSLPLTLTHLNYCSGIFLNHAACSTDDEEELPESLQVFKGYLPRSITSLSQLPRSITKLDCTQSPSQLIEPDTWAFMPSTLTELKIGLSDGPTLAHVQHLPPTIVSITWIFVSRIPTWTRDMVALLPRNLKKLHFGYIYLLSGAYSELPRSITDFSIQNDSLKLTQVIEFLPNIRILDAKINGESSQFSNLPSTLTTIQIPHLMAENLKYLHHSITDLNIGLLILRIHDSDIVFPSSLSKLHLAVNQPPFGFSFPDKLKNLVITSHAYQSASLIPEDWPSKLPKSLEKLSVNLPLKIPNSWASSLPVNLQHLQLGFKDQLGHRNGITNAFIEQIPKETPLISLEIVFLENLAWETLYNLPSTLHELKAFGKPAQARPDVQKLMSSLPRSLGMLTIPFVYHDVSGVKKELQSAGIAEGITVELVAYKS